MKRPLKQLLSLSLCLALLFALSACGADVPSSTLPEPTDEPSSGITDTPTADPQPSQSTPSAGTELPDPDVTPTEEPSPSATQEPDVPEVPAYRFGDALEESEPVEDTYFDTAVFLGDSRTEGLQLFGGIRTGDYYWARGMTVFRVDDPNYAVFEVDGQTYTMIGALRQKEYQSVYIMVGVNELGYAASSYEKGLRAFVDLVLEAQPNAVVYLQILPPVNEEVAHANGLADYINNENIGRFNEAIVRVAEEKRVVLLDTAEVYRDENGSLPADMASDGCHFNYGGYALWADYLRSHTMERERYFSCRAADSAALDEAADASVPPAQTDEEVSEP